MNTAAVDTLGVLEGLAEALQQRNGTDTAWAAIDSALQTLFGHRLFTALVFDRAAGRLARVYSNRPDVNPVGGAKAVTDSAWTRKVLMAGDIHVGSSRQDIQAVFSEYEMLWSIGCESVLNIPIRHGGETVGTLNLLDRAARYDAADLRLAVLVAQLLTGLLLDERAGFAFDAIGAGPLEQV